MNTSAHESWFERDQRNGSVAPTLSIRRHFDDLKNAVARLMSAGVAMKPPVDIREWDGEACHGCFVNIDDATCALHVGHGRYVTLDIQRDLNGVTPSEATRLMLQHSGNVRKPDVNRSYSA